MERITIKDIAMEVGVSHTTVSYVLNNNSNQKISDKTRKAVLEAAKRLKYVPNETARSLRKDSTECISVALEKSVMQNRFSRLLQGIREVLGAEGYGLMLMDFRVKNENKCPEYVESVLQRRTDGVIFISSDGLPPTCSKMIESYNIPFVACDCCPEEEGLASVSFDFEKGAFEVACQLLGEGAEKILYWQPDIDNLQGEYQLCGLKKAMKLYPNSELIVCTVPIMQDSSLDDRHMAFDDMCKQSLSQKVLPRIRSFGQNDAVICGWGVMVKHLCVALYHRNKEKIKIAMLSDSDVPIIPGMKILVSRAGYVKGGRESAKLLLAQIHKISYESRITLAPESPAYVEI